MESKNAPVNDFQVPAARARKRLPKNQVFFVAPPGGEQCYLWQGGRCSAYRYEEAKARSGLVMFSFSKSSSSAGSAAPGLLPGVG